MPKTKCKAYITKYALTQGIYLAEGELETDSDIFKEDVFRFGYAVYRSSDFKLILEEAEKDFEERLAREIAKTEKKLVRLKTLVFEKVLKSKEG
jgi:hypothetical protein